VFLRRRPAHERPDVRAAVGGAHHPASSPSRSKTQGP
jgi:hypothetical protein